MPKGEQNWGENIFGCFLAVIGLGILIGGWISGAGFWLPLIGFLVIMAIGGASMGGRR